MGYVGDDERDEARFVSDEIDKLTDQRAARPGDVAVFYRTNAQSRVFEETFIRTGMAYKVVGGVRFYERREVRDVLAYLRMLVNPADEISLRRVLNTPKRGIGERAEACIASLAERDRITFWEALLKAEDAPGLATRSLRAINGFVALAEELQSMVDAGERADVIVESVLDRSGYLAELEASTDPQDATRVENLAELVAVAREFSDDPVAGPSADPADVEAGLATPTLADFLERVALGGRCRPDPGEPRRPGGRSRHVDDAAHRQGAGVSGRLPDRARRRHLPALPRARRPDRAGGGAASGVRRSHPRPAAPLPLPRGRRGRPGARRCTTRRRGSSTRCPSTWSSGAARRPPRPDGIGRISADRSQPRVPMGVPTASGRRNFSSAALRADAAAKAKPAREMPSLEPGDRVSHDSFGLGTVVTVEGRDDKTVASVDFGSQGVKRLLLRYAPVEKFELEGQRYG